MSILYLFLVLFIALWILIFWIVTTSCALAWYEYSNRDPQLLASRFLPERRYLALRLILVEAWSIFLAVCAYPFGFLPRKPQTLMKVAQKRPVLLLHGLFHNRAVWFLMKQRLDQCGFPVVTINLPPYETVETLARRIATAVEETLVTYDAEQVDIVGHSMGGLLARYYIEFIGGDKRVNHCILLGAPNAGSKLAPFALSPLGRDLMPGSEFLTELNAAPLSAAVSYVTIFSRHDNLVIPAESAELPGAEAIEIEWLGHNSLIFHRESIEATIDALRVA
jgi:triacylglycerol esterase/lipase EstA (alpha/beta hydrolase family)